MKIMAKLIMLLVVLAFCMPAQADILIYNKSVKYEGVELGETTDDLYRCSYRGYLILEVTFDPNGEIDTIDEAVQIIYWRDGQTKYTDDWEHDFDIARFEEGNISGYGLTESDTGEGYFYASMLSGRARDMDIGFEDVNEVPQQLKGTTLEHDTGNYSEVGSYNLRLNNSWTRFANEEGYDAEDAYDDIVDMLADRGYPTVTE